MLRSTLSAGLCLGLATLLPAVASAQDVLPFDPDGDGTADVLIPRDIWPEWAARGTGSPNVVYDEVDDQWVMLFEARISDAYLDALGTDYEACRVREGGARVVWGIGRATSPDGLTDWVIDPDPVVLPDATWKSCSTSHPWVVVSEGAWHLYFKAEQGFEPCPDGVEPPPWGCGRMTGVGYATSDDGGASWAVTESPEPMITVTDFGFPAVVTTQEPGAPVEEQRWSMLLTRPGGLFLATSGEPDSGWELSMENPVLQPGTWAFAEDEWFQPSLTCNDEEATFTYTAWIGGSTRGGASGFTPLNSIDGVDWLGTGVPIVRWEGEPEWRHWDAVKVGDEVYVYYTTRDEDNQIEVRLVKLGEDPEFSLDPGSWGGRSCLYGERPADTGPTDEPTDPVEPGPTDPITGEPPDEEGCYCSSSASPLSAWWLLGLAALGLARRRR